MKNKKDILPIIIASVIALLITILVRFLLPGGTLTPVRASQNSEITMPKIPLIMKGETAKEVQVLCVSTKIAKGNKIQNDQLSWKKWPEDALQPYYIAKSANGNPLNNGADYSNALKMWAISDIPAGIPLTMQMLTDEDPAKKAAEAQKARKEQKAKDEAKKAAELKKIEQEKAKNTIAKGMRAVTFNVNQQSAVSTGMMKVGDYVDIVIMQQQNGQTVTHKYNALKVLAIDGASETKQEKKGGLLGSVSSIGGIFSPRNITLEVQADLVNIMISQAANNGVIVSLRNQDEEKEKQQAQAEEEPQEEISEDQIGKGMRAVTFAVNQQSAVSTSMMKVGDYVDIVIMQQQNGQNVTRKYSSLKILAIDGITGTRSAKKGAVENAGPVTVPRNITLEVPVDRVDEMIAQATNSGVVISLRNQDEEDQQPQANSEKEEKSSDEDTSNEKTAASITKGMRAVTFNVNQQSSVSTSMMKVGDYVDIVIMQQQDGQNVTRKYTSLKILAIDGVAEPKGNGKNDPITFPRNITLEVPANRVDEMIAQATNTGVIVSLRNQDEQAQAEDEKEAEHSDEDAEHATTAAPISKGMRAVTFAVNQQSAVSTSMMKVGDYVDIVIMQQQEGQTLTHKYSSLKILAIDGVAEPKGNGKNEPITFPRNITLEVPVKRVNEMIAQATTSGVIVSLRNQDEQAQADDDKDEEESDKNEEKTAEPISKGMRAVTFAVNQQSAVSTSMMKVGDYVDIVIMQQQEGQTLTHKYSSLKILAIDGVAEPKANGKNEPITFPRNITLEVPVKRVNEMIAQATTSGVIVSLRNQEEQEQAEDSEEEESDKTEETAAEPITKGMRAVTFAVNQQSAVSTSMMKVGDYVDVVIMQQQNGQNVTRKYSALKILAIDGIAGGKKVSGEDAPVTFPRNITLEVAAKRVDEMLTQAASTGIILSLRNQEEEKNEALDGQSEEEQEQSAARDVLLKNIASMNRSTSAELMKDIKQKQETEQKHMDELIHNMASISNRQFTPAFKQQSKGGKKSGSRMEMVSGKVVGEEQMPEPVKINIYKTGQPVETIQIEQ